MSILFYLIVLIINFLFIVSSEIPIIKAFQGESLKISCSNSTISKISSLIELWKDNVKLLEGKNSLYYFMNPVLVEDTGAYLCKYLAVPNNFIEKIHLEIIDLNQIVDVQIPSIVYHHHESNFKCAIDYNVSFNIKLVKPNYSSKTSLRSEVCVVYHRGYKIAEKIITFMPPKNDKSVFLEEFIPLKGNPFIKIISPACMSKKDFVIRIICDGKEYEADEKSPMSLISAINNNFKYGTHFCKFFLSDYVYRNEYVQIAFEISDYPIHILRVERVKKNEFHLKWKEHGDFESNSICYFQVRKNLRIIKKFKIILHKRNLLFNISSNELLNGEIICHFSSKRVSSNIAYFSLIQEKPDFTTIKFHPVEVKYNSAILGWYDSHRDIGEKIHFKVSQCLIGEARTQDDPCIHKVYEIYRSRNLVQYFTIPHLLPERTYKVNMIYKSWLGEYTNLSDDLIFKTKASPHSIPYNINVLEGHNFIRITWNNSLQIDFTNPFIIFHITTKTQKYNIHVMKNTTMYKINKDFIRNIKHITMQTSRFYDKEFILSNHHIIYQKGQNKLLTIDVIFPFIFALIFVLMLIAQMIYYCFKID